MGRSVLLKHFTYWGHATESFVVEFLVLFVVDVVFGGVLAFFFVSEVLVLLSGISDHGWDFEALFGFGDGVGWGHGLAFVALLELVSGVVVLIVLIEPALVSPQSIRLLKYDFLFFLLILYKFLSLRIGQFGEINSLLPVIKRGNGPLLGLIIILGLLNNQLNLIISQQHLQNCTILTNFRLLISNGI